MFRSLGTYSVFGKDGISCSWWPNDLMKRMRFDGIRRKFMGKFWWENHARLASAVTCQRKSWSGSDFAISAECRRKLSFALVLLYFAHWLFGESRATFSAMQWEGKPKPFANSIARAQFPALWAGYKFESCLVYCAICVCYSNWSLIIALALVLRRPVESYYMDWFGKPLFRDWFETRTTRINSNEYVSPLALFACGNVIVLAKSLQIVTTNNRIWWNGKKR